MANTSIMRRNCFSLALMFILFLAGVSGIMTKDRKYKFTHTIPAARGTVVIYTRRGSPLICSMICFQDDSCTAFNYLPSTGTCEILGNIYVFHREAGSEMYVPYDIIEYYQMTSDCSNCLPGMFPGTDDSLWYLNCRDDGFLHDIGTQLQEMSNIEYLACRRSATVTLDYENQGIVLVDSLEDCTSALGRTAVPVAIWSDDFSFSNTTSFAVMCRAVLSGQQVDLDNCYVPDMIANTKIINNIISSANFMSCSYETLPISLHLASDGQYRLKCCTFNNFMYN